MDLFLKISSVWLYPRSSDHLVSGSWLPKQCQANIPSGEAGLKLNQMLVDYSHKFYAIVSLAYFALRTD